MGRERAIAAGLLLLVAGAVAALRLYNHYYAQRVGSGAYVPVKERLTPEVRMLQQYVRIDTSNPPGNESEGARWLGSILQRHGIPFEIIESAPRRTNLYARLKGRRPGNGLLLLNHIDVVPAQSTEWSVAPFEGVIRLNALHGRGTLDMKGVTLCQLLAFIHVATSGARPEHDLVFLATADEEQGSAFGTQWLLANRGDVFEGVRYVLSEGGVTEMQLETVRYFGIEIGGKQVTTVDLDAPSREALQRLRLALEPYFVPDQADRVLPGVRAYFGAIASQRVENRDLFVDIDRAIAGGKFWLLPVNYRTLLQNNVWATGVRPHGPVHRMRVHLSNLPDEIPERRIQWLEELARREGARIAEVIRKEGPVPLSSPDTPLFAMLRRETMRKHPGAGVGPHVLGSSTSDCRFLRQQGMECYGFQPFRVDYFQSFSMHGVDERIRLDWFMEGVALMREVVVAYTGNPGVRRETIVSLPPPSDSISAAQVPSDTICHRVEPRSVSRVRFRRASSC